MDDTPARLHPRRSGRPGRPHGRAVLVVGTAVASVLLAVGVAAQAPELVVRRTGASVHVRFDLRPTNVDDLASRLRSAEPVSVTWAIDIRREVPVWFDRDVTRFEFDVVARPSTSAGAVEIQRSIRGRPLGTPVVLPIDAAIRGLTSFEEIELPNAAPAEGGAPYRVAITARVSGGGKKTVTTAELARADLAP